MLSANNLEQSNWNRDYDELVQSVVKRGVHPVKEDNPDELYRITDHFLRLFDKAKQEAISKLATDPLFPINHTFKDPFAESVQSTRPLDYIMLTANYEGLKALMPYLTDEDLLRRGPYQSTFLHAVIAGIEKESTVYGEPVECVQELLTRFPFLKEACNVAQANPMTYLEKVKSDLVHNLDYIKKHGRMERYTGELTVHTDDIKGGWYISSDASYKKLIEQAAQLEKLLK